MGKQTRASDINQESSIPQWDTTPIFMRAWLDALPDYLEKLDQNYVSWWSQGLRARPKWNRVWTDKPPYRGTP